MTNTIIQHYIKLTEFLGMVLGPDYEVALHDASDPDNSIVAISNGHISGRTIGAPLTEYAKKCIGDRVYENDDSRINYTGIAMENGNMLRSSTFYIKDSSGLLIGMLCINFDDSRYRELSDRLLKLRHPDSYVETNFVFNEEKARAEGIPAVGSESFHGSVASATEEAIDQVLQNSGVPVERLTKEEKMQIIAILDEKGVFLLKNAVKQVSKLLHCSQASVYRYINKLNNNQ